jgi:acyl CoA:acetate/3-ketoacid CoA transferase
MAKLHLLTLAKAACLIPDDAMITVSSSSGLGCPDAMLRAIGERFRETGRPRNLTSVHPIAAGDMYGIAGIDHLATPGLLKRVIAGSLPSGPSSLPSPAIWKLITENKIEAYNLPSGLLFHLHREAAAGRPGILTKVGLDTFVDPRRQGGKMNDFTQEDLVQLVEFDGEEWLYIRSLHPQIAIIRGTTADEFGNISMEHEGAYLGALDQALAVRNAGGTTIAQVKRLAAKGSLRPQNIRIPGTLVDYVVLDPDQKQTTQTVYDPAISGEISQPDTSFETVGFGIEKWIARRAALELHTDDAVNLGFGICALVPRILLEEKQHGAVTWVIEQGAVGGMPLLGFAFGCAGNADAIVGSPDQFTYFQGGGFDCSMLSFLQIDESGSVNVSRLASRPHVTAGAGGFIDITACAKAIVFCGTFTAGGLDARFVEGRLDIVREGKSRKFVKEVEHVTFSGRQAKEQKQQVTYVTERCVVRLEPDGLTVIEVAPGIDLEKQVLAQAECELEISPNLRTMDPRIFLPCPIGLQLSDPRRKRVD